MGAHTLLAMHNLTVLDRFFEGIREVLGALALSSDEDEGEKGWMEEVDRFCRMYDEVKSRELVECAERDWRDVDRARGKGRLARERQAEIPN
jgi:queuine tRNA-ribosyltransferase